MPVVVDTDVLSFLYKRDSRARLYEPYLNDPPFFLSFMSLAELRRWSLERRWGESRRRELEDYLARYVVVHSDELTCEWWAQAINSARLEGRPIGAADAWIAATALRLRIPLVTHNPTHYKGIDGLQVISKA